MNPEEIRRQIESLEEQREQLWDSYHNHSTFLDTDSLLEAINAREDRIEYLRRKLSQFEQSQVIKPVSGPKIAEILKRCKKSEYAFKKQLGITDKDEAGKQRARRFLKGKGKSPTAPADAQTLLRALQDVCKIPLSIEDIT